MADTARVVELITTITANPPLRDRLAAASDEDRTAILAEIGFPDLTPADVAASAATLVPRVIDELDDADLEAVAGGDWGNPTDATWATTTVGIAAASAAAAT